MISIKKCPVPANSMLARYSTKSGYADCYWTEVPGHVSFPDFVFTFYTTPLFKLERIILKLTVAKTSTEIQARQLAEGLIHRFAAWDVENRSENEIILCDFAGRTRSWLKSVPINLVNGTRTELYFGSAVVPRRNPKTGTLSLGFGYRALLGFHKIYSSLLLCSAALRVQHQIRNSRDGYLE